MLRKYLEDVKEFRESKRNIKVRRLEVLSNEIISSCDLFSFFGQNIVKMIQCQCF